MDRLSIIDSESRRLAEVLAGVDPDSRCPSCPDWTASDLLWHLTEVHYSGPGSSSGTSAPSPLPAVEAAEPERPATSPTDSSFASGRRRPCCEARRPGRRRPLWSWWAPDQTVGFTRRMQTYEATMHRVDAELTAGLPIGPIADDVAAGAIDHAVDVMWGWKPDEATYAAAAVVEFVASDTGQRWLVEVGSWTASDGDGSGPSRRGPPRASRRRPSPHRSSILRCGRGRAARKPLRSRDDRNSSPH